MSNASAPRVRRSIADIQKDYDAGNKAELENLMRAWKGLAMPDLKNAGCFGRSTPTAFVDGRELLRMRISA